MNGLDDLNATTVCQRAPEALDWVASLAPRAGHHLGRIAAYRRFAKRFLEGPDRTRPMKRSQTLCFCDLATFVRLHHFRHVFQALSGFPLTLRMAVGGSDLYGRDRDRTSRNFQFELDVALLFLMLGFNLRDVAESDVTAVVAGSDVLVECKRPTNVARLVERIDDAFEQVDARRLRHDRALGLVAVDVTILANPEHRHWRVSSAIESHELSSRLGEQVRKQLREIVVPLLRGRLNLGVLCALHLPIWVGEFGWHDWRLWIPIYGHAEHVRTRGVREILFEEIAALYRLPAPV